MPGLKKIKAVILPVALFCNTIIGVGIFALPYVASVVGVRMMLAYFLFLGLLVTAIHLMFAELALNSPDYIRLPGFAKLYLGKWAEIVAFVCTIVGLVSALVAFIIVGGQFAQNLFEPFFGGNTFIYSFLYFAAGAVCVYFGTKAVLNLELLGLGLFAAVLAALSCRGMAYFNFSNVLAPGTDAANILFPYGTVLFSLWGASSIPEVEEALGRENRKELLNPVIVACGLVSIAVYVFFILLILGITGPSTTESALIGLKSVLPGGLISLCFLFGLIITFTTFMILGLTLKKILVYDLKMGKKAAWAVTAAAPFLLFLAGVKSFIAVFGFVGGVLLGIDGILILLMYRKFKPRSGIAAYPLIVFLSAAVICEIVRFFR